MEVTRRNLTVNDVLARLRSLCEGLSEFDSLKAETCIAALEAQLSTLKTLNQEYLRRANAVAQDHPPAEWLGAVEKERHEFENFHNNLCKRFGYHHDPIDWNRDLASLEEHIASLIPKKTLQDRVEEIILQAGLTKTAKTLAAEIVAELKGAGE